MKKLQGTALLFSPLDDIMDFEVRSMNESALIHQFLHSETSMGASLERLFTLTEKPPLSDIGFGSRKTKENINAEKIRR